MSDGVWIFGYGSLVSPASITRTIGREVDPTDGFGEASLSGFGRRWNYGSMHLRGDWVDGELQVRNGLVVSLGLEVADDEHCNGAIVRVTADELAALDWRERDYERVDVTDRITVDRPVGRIDTYVPRPSAVERYLAARDDRRAAIRRSYWELVHTAFEALGGEHLERFTSTPAPDVPVVDIELAD